MKNLFSREFLLSSAIALLLLLLFVAVGVSYNQKQQIVYAQSVYHAQEVSLVGHLSQVKDSLSATIRQVNDKETRIVALKDSNQNIRGQLQSQTRYIVGKLSTLESSLRAVIRAQQNVTSLKVESSGQFFTITKDTITTQYSQHDSLGLVIKDTVKTLSKGFVLEDAAGWYKVSGLLKGDSIAVVGVPTFENPLRFRFERQKKKKRFALDIFPPKTVIVEAIPLNPSSRQKSIKAIVK